MNKKTSSFLFMFLGLGEKKLKNEENKIKKSAEKAPKKLITKLSYKKIMKLPANELKKKFKTFFNLISR